MEKMLAQSLAPLGFDMLLARKTRAGMLKIVIDNEAGVSLQDCEFVASHLRSLLPVEGITYQGLEISSPGPNRPLSKPAHFIRFIGSQAVVHLRFPDQERSSCRGEIVAADETAVELVNEAGRRTFAYQDLCGANLSDESEARQTGVSA